MTHPAWGSLPLEHFVLSQWTSHADLEPDARRKRLARAFTELGDQNRHPFLSTQESASPPTDAPPESEWQGILAPLRTEEQRLYALHTSFGAEGLPNPFGILWLRTCYGEGRDDQHAELLGSLNIELALEVEQNVLNDAALYERYAAEPARLFDVMPERLLQLTMEPGTLDGAKDRDDKVQRLMEEFAEQHGDDVADLDADEYRAATADFHFWSIKNYYFVADQTALETGKALVVFFDDHGRTVRSARIQADLCEDTAGAWADGTIQEQPEFEEAEVGKDYGPGGVCGFPSKSE